MIIFSLDRKLVLSFETCVVVVSVAPSVYKLCNCFQFLIFYFVSSIIYVLKSINESKYCLSVHRGAISHSKAETAVIDVHFRADNI